MMKNFSEIGKSGMSYRQIRDVFMFLMLFIALSLGSTAYASDDHSFYGNYSSYSHRCEADNYNLTLTSEYVSWIGCEHQAYTLLKQDNEQLILRIAPSSTCSGRYVRRAEVVKIILQKPRWPGDMDYVISNYKTYDKYLKGESHDACSYTKGDPQ